MDDTGVLTEPFESLEALVEAEGLVPAEALARARSILARKRGSGWVRSSRASGS